MPRTVDLSLITQQLQDNDPDLRSLDLSAQELLAREVEGLAQALTRNTSLTSLNLAGNSIGNEGATELAKALIQNTSLRSLDLKFCSIEKEGVTEITKAVIHNIFLTSLDLWGNEEGIENAIEMAKALRRNKKAEEKAKEKAFVLEMIDLAGVGILPLDIFKMIGHTAAKNMAPQRRHREIDRMLSLVYVNVRNRTNDMLTTEEKKWKNEFDGERVFDFPLHSPFFSSPSVRAVLSPEISQKDDTEECLDKPQQSSRGWCGIL